MFHKLKLEELELCKDYLQYADNLSTDYSPLTIYAWQDYYHTSYDIIEECFICRFGSGNDNCLYLCPVGRGDVRKAIKQIETIHQKNNSSFEMLVVENQRKYFDESYACVRSESNDDYIYLASDLAKLSGKKYHSKRNLISQFNNKYNWSIKKIAPSNVNDCKTILQKWYEGNDMSSYSAELLILDEYETLKEVLNLIGCVLYVDHSPVAFCLASLPNPKVVDIHLEKADVSYIGAYAKIMNEFAKIALDEHGVEYINREEDMGMENLRKAKKSLHPAFMVEKYIYTKKY